ncbi:MAG: non-lysosomal glucosylceramidase [Vallitalea sp.]|jgi:uncharacterized protein (DUF608 family)|nr:non-lysosomal glucosylceramidase [Vallitalea sp.]
MSFTYKNEKANVVSFPLGGIGSGSIGLSGTGRLIDWEIFNRPNKGTTNGYSHFSIKAESNNELLDARILHGDFPKHYMGEGIGGSHHSWGIGHGPNRTTLSSMPHFSDVTFTGTFPTANINYSDEQFPGTVELTAFNPFIPSNDKDSSIPAAFFNWTIHNPTSKEITYTIGLSVKNPFEADTHNTFVNDANYSMINMTSDEFKSDDIKYGNMTIATNSSYSISYQENWYRGTWFDDLSIYWDNFTTVGSLVNRSYEESGKGDMCTLAVTVTVAPHEKASVPYIIGWYYPNCTNYWAEKKDESGIENKWKNYYCKLFKDSMEVVTYGLNNWDNLYGATKLFRDALFTSTLPTEVLDAVQANISILKTATCLRLENGEFYGWEGINARIGSCEGSCTHVWNYAYALPFLFPSLERSMRDLDYKYNIGDIGDMTFRLQLPLGKDRWFFRPCADGQFGGIIKVYRDWKISGDSEWLKKLWPDVKKSLEFAWHPGNTDLWDPDKTGVLWGRQHHTLDMELFGPNSWLTGLYLAALKSASEMAHFLGEEDTANEYKAIFQKGKEFVDTNLFNGSYYSQNIDLKDISIVEKFNDDDRLVHGDGTTNTYWNSEVEEIKYQIGEGCIIDQVLAGWHANLSGLGEIFDKENCKTALKSLYDNNYKSSMRNNANPCRSFSVNDEAGILICAWPEGTPKPIVPVPYAEETMNGFEYAAACHMIQEGLVIEGQNIVKGIRDRYDGEKRNPWNEMECGNNYARSMASYALLLTYSGFNYNMVDKMIGFNPIENQNYYRTFWSIDGAWGTFEINNNTLQLNVLYGQLELNKFGLPSNIEKINNVFASTGNIDYLYDSDNTSLIFNKTLTLGSGDSLHILI